MPRVALVTAMSMAALLGCATARPPASATSDLATASSAPPATVPALSPVAEPVKPEPTPAPLHVVAPTQAPMTAALLKARLVEFILQAQAVRERVPAGTPVPEERVAAWRRVTDDIDRFLDAAPAPDESEDVQVARGSLRAALDQDGRAYQGGLPPGLVGNIEERLIRLAARGGPTPARFQWPLPEVRVTSQFGRRFHPIAHRTKMHTGVDLVAERNAPVLSAGPGVVVRAGWMHGYGYEVTVDHGAGRFTRYSHLARTLVLEGAQVATGMPLGLAGRTGTATGVHLHFEFLKDETPLDPLRDFAKLVGDEGPKPVVLAPTRTRRHRTVLARKPEGPGA